MAITAYDRQFNFQNQQALTPSTPLPAQQVDAEYNAIKITLDSLISDIANILRDDGALQNGVVGPDQLSAELNIGIQPPTEWATATSYAVLDTVFESGILYRCVTAHVSGTFATDLAAEKWIELYDFNALFTSLAEDIGLDGWSPVFGAEEDGERRVLKIVNWVGGDGEEPLSPVYVGSIGTVETVAEATDIRGAVGPAGTAWSPVFEIASDGERRVLRIDSWAGGTGSVPQDLLDLVGYYVGASGLVTLIADGADVRGSSGAGAVSSVNGQEPVAGNVTLNAVHIPFDDTGLAIILAADVQAALADLDAALAGNLAEWATLNPSANGGSLVTAADYAAMRALLDLEAGTDFYSKTAADAAFQPLDADLTSIAALTTTTYGRAFLELANQAALMTLLSAASTSASGIAELATDGEAQAKSDTGRVLTPSNLSALGASTSFQGLVEMAVDTEFRAGTSEILALSPDAVFDAAAEVTLTDAATIAVGFSTFFNAVVTLGGNRAMGNPTNEKPGQSGVIRVVQDGTGGRTLSYGTDWEFASGTAPTLSTAANAQDLLFYHIIASDRVFAHLVKGIA